VKVAPGSRVLLNALRSEDRATSGHLDGILLSFEQALTQGLRAELGYPIMVTPFPQIVCTQALFNVVGHERYTNIPDQVIRYVLGRFGRPTAPVDDNVRDRILATPRAKEILDEPPPPDLRELRKRFGEALSDDEFLLRAVMPAEQIDAMKASGPAKRHYNPDAKPLLALLREAAQKPSVSHIVIEKPGLRIELSGRAAHG